MNSETCESETWNEQQAIPWRNELLICRREGANYAGLIVTASDTCRRILTPTLSEYLTLVARVLAVENDLKMLVAS